MPGDVDEIYRSIRFDSDEADFSKWPKLSCSAANELTLATPPTEDDPNPGFARLAIAGELKLQAGVAVNELSSDEKLTNNSDLAIPTQKAVKTYVDAQIGQVNQSLSVKAALAGASSQDFQTKNLTVSGNLTTTGNVGISTASPSTKLEISGGRLKVSTSDANSAGVIEISNKSKTNYIFTDGDTGDLFLRTDSSNHDLILQAGGSQGKVGIGTPDPKAKLHVVGDLLGAAKGFGGEAFRIAVGQTPVGATNWVQYGTDGIYVEIDTSTAGFSSVPFYFTSIGGSGHHWATQGATSIYNQTAKSFRVYVLQPGITAATAAKEWYWHINWIAIGN